jgi:hypothetical protein
MFVRTQDIMVTTAPDEKGTVNLCHVIASMAARIYLLRMRKIIFLCRVSAVKIEMAARRIVWVAFITHNAAA